MSTFSDTGDILLVDPDADITTLLRDSLVAEGYGVDACGDAETALTRRLDTYSLIITEVQLPGMDGFTFLGMVKEGAGTSAVPVMFCTVTDSEASLVRGLNEGADDYVVKPFSLRELMARVKSVLRRHRRVAAVRRAALENSFKTLVVNVERQSVTIDSQAVNLSPTEFQILTMLFKSRNRFFDRVAIASSVWPGEPDSASRKVDVNISRLRKKLGLYGANIVSRTGMGYGFIETPN